MVNDTITSLLTKDDLVFHLKRIGIENGDVLEVHSSLSSLGYVIGGAQSVVDALLKAVGEEGTLVMPLQFSNNSEPLYWQNPPIDISLMATVRKKTPPFDPICNDLSGMGEVVENLRRRKNAIFSSHPSCAFVAYGKYAPLICNRQSYHFPLGDDSPTARLVETRAKFLCIGTQLDTLTSLHLAQYRANTYPVCINGANILTNGTVNWKKYLDLYGIDSDWFVKIQPALLKRRQLFVDKIGLANVYYGYVSQVVEALTKHLEVTTPLALYS